MVTRREALSYISAGTMFGGIAGYYVGAQELLGIQSDTVVRESAPAQSDTSSDPSDTSTDQSDDSVDDTPNTEGSSEFFDDYERNQITDLVTLNEPLDRWEITNGINGRSLQGEGGSDSPGPGARVVYDPDQYSWSGNRQISVQYKTDPSLSKRHAQLFFFDDGSWWQIAATESLNSLRLRWENQEGGSLQNVDTRMESGTVHEITVNIEDATITASLDGEELIEHTHTERIGSGTVGFGVGDGRRTWFDNLRIQPL